jgi:hypothetical protein
VDRTSASGSRAPNRRAALRALVAGALMLLVGTALAGPGAAATTGRPAPSADVVGDDQADRYVGSGALVIPARGWQGGDDARASAAGCEDCRWRITEVCTKSEFAAGGCRDISLGCPIGTDRVRVWLARPGEDWSLLGTTCLGDAPPTTRTELGAAVAERVARALPPLVLGADPPGGTLVGLPAVLRAGQSAAGLRDVALDVVGLSVDLDARARWRWDHGDGTATWTDGPGGRWPDDTVAHTYRRAGTYLVRVDAVWRATYTVEGLGPFAVPGTLTQTDTLDLRVREARAVLVG